MLERRQVHWQGRRQGTRTGRRQHLHLRVRREKCPRRQRRKKRIHVSNRLIVASALQQRHLSKACCLVLLRRFGDGDGCVCNVAGNKASDPRVFPPAQPSVGLVRETHWGPLIQLCENATATCPETRLVSCTSLSTALPRTTRHPCALHPPPIHRSKIRASPPSTAQNHNILKQRPKSPATRSRTTSPSRQSSLLHPARISLATSPTIDNANSRSSGNRRLPHSTPSPADRHPCLGKRHSQSRLPRTSNNNCPRT